MKHFYTFLIAILLSSLGFGQSPGDLLITEFMADPLNVGDTSGEYFEVYNTTGSAIDIDGWTIEDDGSDSHVISGTVVVPANGFAILAISGDPAGDGSVTPNYIYSGITLANGADEIVLTTPGATEIARVNYNDGDEFGDGVALELEDISIPVNGAYTISGSGVNAVAATDSLGSGGDLGSPGSAGNTMGFSPPNDTDTEIAAPSSGQVMASTIIAANTTSAINAVPVFRFNIEDQGTADGLPTNVTRMRFTPGTNNTADWTDHIQDIVMTNVTDAIDLTPLTTVTINDLEIIVDYGPPVVILDNGFKEFEVSIYLNVDEILDGAVVQMEIPAAGSGFQADPSGSTFLEPQPGTITGPQMPIDVVGTGLEFQPQPLPSQAGLNQQMPLFDVLAVDINGNLDLDYGQTIDITSSGTLDMSPVSQMATNGVASFNSVTHTALGVGIQLTATDDSMPTQLTGMSSSFDVVLLPTCLAFQSFGADGGDWSFITDPAQFNGADVWDVVDSSFRSFATIASDGSEFFGVQDLASPSGTAVGEFGEIQFSQVDVSIYENVIVSFDYEVDGYDNGDDIEYELFVDGVSQGRVLLVDGFSNLDQDGTVSIPVPFGAANVSLIIYIKQNGDDFAGLDNFKITGFLPSIVYEGNDSNGFGGPLGEGDLEIDAFSGLMADFTLIKGSGAFGNNNDQMVIYIDSQAGGITGTSGLTDTGDPGRSAISGVGGGNQAILNFPPGFEADFAIAIDENFANLFEIVVGGSHNFVASAGLSPTGTTGSATYDFSINFADINSTAGSGSFKFLATYINPDVAFRSNEFIGDSDYNNNALGNPGQTTVNMNTYFQVSDRIKGGRASSANSGNWSDNTTWTNGNAPLEGDVITIDHDVAQDVSYSSSNNLGSDSIEVTGANTLTVNAGSTLEMRDGIIGTGNLVVNGTLSLTQGGFTDIVPTYNALSTLEYRDITGTYNRFSEWLAGSAGPGVPDNVVIDNTDLDLSNPSGDTSDQSFTVIDDLTLLNGANLNIDATKNLTVGDNLSNTGSTIAMTSTSTRYPSLIVSGTSTGNVTYNRFVNTNNPVNGNDLVSAPVTGQAFDVFIGNNTNILANPSGTNVLFGGFDNNDAMNPFELWDEADMTPLTPGIGYRTGIDSGAGSNLVSFVGDVNTSLVQVAISQGSASILNLVGNPFTSYLNAQDFLTQNAGLLDPSAQVIYGYNDSTDGTSSDDYTIISSLENTGLNIAPGQGFFIASNLAGGNIQFTTNSPDMRLTSTDDDFIAGRNSSEITNVNINLNNGLDNFITKVYFTSSSGLGLDPGYDASLLGGVAPAFSIYSHLVEDNMDVPFATQAIGKTDYNDNTVTIALGVNANMGEQLTFSIAENTLPASVEVYLDDTLTSTSTLLNTNNYVLTPSTDLSGTGRFYLRFTNSALSIFDNNFDDISIYTNQNNRTINIAGALEDSTVANIYDIQGRLITSRILNSSLTLQSIDVNAVNSGVYIIELSNENQNKTKKVILK